MRIGIKRGIALVGEERSNNKDKKTVQILTYTYLVIVALTILFFQRGLGDIRFHLMRLHGIASNITSGLSPRIYAECMNGYGYGAPMFYGDIFMYPFALLVVLGVNTIWAHKLMLLTLWFCAFVSIRFVLHNIFGDEFAANVGVLVYMLNGNIYSNVEGSIVGRAFAWIFVPLAIYGIYKIFNGEYRRMDFAWLSIGVAGLICCQIIDAVICVIVLTVIVLCELVSREKKNWGILVARILIAAIVCLLMTAWIIFPMLEQFASQKFFVTSDIVSTGKRRLGDYVIPWYGWMIPYDILYAYYGLIGKDYNRLYGFGWLSTLIITALYIWNRRRIESKSILTAMLIVMLGAVLFQTAIFPHDALQPFIGTIQFPWRVIIVGTMALSFISASMCKSLGEGKASSIIILTVLYCGVMSYLGGTGRHAERLLFETDYAESLYQFNENSIMSGEFLPEKIKTGTTIGPIQFIEERGDAVTSDNEKVHIESEKSIGRVSIKYYENERETVFELPLIYYKGYYAKDVLTDQEIPVSESERGLVQVTVSDKQGEIKIWYKGTMLQHVTVIISAVTVSILLLYWGVAVIKPRTNAG